jgi:hypothetical protein
MAKMFAQLHNQKMPYCARVDLILCILADKALAANHKKSKLKPNSAVQFKRYFHGDIFHAIVVS